jgi:N-methylhydantoinase A/oxoprolinase/acetone carboxylase beta subunit
LRVVAERPVPPPKFATRAGVGRPTPYRREIVVDGARVRVEVWPLGELPPGLEIKGPAILAGPDATGLIAPGWRGVVHECGAVVLERR